MNFSNVDSITIPEGKVKKIIRNGAVVWKNYKKYSYTFNSLDIAQLPYSIDGHDAFNGSELLVNEIKGKTINRILPDEYQEVEYLESHGTEYINTNLISNDFDNKFRVIISCKQTVKRLSTSYLFASDASGGRSCNISMGGGNRGWQIYGGNDPAAELFAINSKIDCSLNKWYNINCKITNDASTQKLVINDIEMTTLGIIRNSYSSKAFTLFRMKYSDDSATFIGEISKFEFYNNNNELVSKLVPCYRKSDNKPGMYDTVTAVFRTNQGTGEFSVGPIVNALKSVKLDGFKVNGINFNRVSPIHEYSYSSDYLKYNPVNIAILKKGTYIMHSSSYLPTIQTFDIKTHTQLLVSKTTKNSPNWYSTWNDNALAPQSNTLKEGTIEILQDCIVCMCCQYGEIQDLQIELGSTKHSYKPYIEPFALTFPSKQTLSSVNDVYDKIQIVKNESDLYDVVKTTNVGIDTDAQSVYELATPTITTIMSSLTENQAIALTELGGSIEIVGNENKEFVKPDLVALVDAKKEI